MEYRATAAATAGRTATPAGNTPATTYAAATATCHTGNREPTSMACSTHVAATRAAAAATPNGTAAATACLSQCRESYWLSCRTASPSVRPAGDSLSRD